MVRFPVLCNNLSRCGNIIVKNTKIYKKTKNDGGGKKKDKQIKIKK